MPFRRWVQELWRWCRMNMERVNKSKSWALSVARGLVGLIVAVVACDLLMAQDYRSFDGSGNNPSHPDWGIHGSTLGRLAPANYTNGYDSLDGALPNPRTISNRVFAQSESIPDARGLSEWVWVWGQFIDHDIDHTLVSSSAGMMHIPIPSDDPVFGGLPQGSAISVSRAMYQPGTGIDGSPPIPREHPNNLTPWLDAGMVYGDRFLDGPPSVLRSQWLRDPQDMAKLRVSDGGALGSLLPRYVHGESPVMANTHTPGMTSSVEGDLAYVAGDVRANENTSLLVTHTIFVREHNRLVDVMRQAGSSLSDQQLYDRARKIVGAQVQAITYNEYLPALGVNLPEYSGYRYDLHPTVFTEFTNAAFRTPHTQINSQQLRLDENGMPIAEGHLSLADSFFNPQKLLEGGLEPLIRGLAAQVQEASNTKMVDALRNQLFDIFVPGFGLVPSATDLAAIDIVRGRDVGLSPLNAVRSALGLSAHASFGDITSDGDLALGLAELYEQVDKIDLFVGLLAEDHLSGSNMGETTMAIFELQFGILRDSDRFWYQYDLDGVNSDLQKVAAWGGGQELAAIDWLNSLRLSDILNLNSNARVHSNVFFVVPEPSSILLLFLAAVVCALAPRRLARRPQECF